MDITITKLQKKFIDSRIEETLFGGSAGGGKSYGQLIDAWLYGLEFEGSKQLVLRRTFPELKRSLILQSFEIYSQEMAKYHQSDHKWTIGNGSTIEFGYCDSEGDVTKYQSAEYDVIRFDELTHFTEYQYTYLKSRIRGVNNYPKMMKASTNPGGVGHLWVKEKFIDNKEPGKVYTDEFDNRSIFIPAKIQDNKFLMEADPDYVKRLEQLDENTKKALLYGDWDIFEGQYFSEFNKEKHVIKPFEIPQNWARFRGMDWGYNDPCAILWFAVSPDSHVYVYREMYVNETLSSDVAKEVVKLSVDEYIDYTSASPDMWAKRGRGGLTGETTEEDFSSNGVPLIRADNQRILGWQRIREFLSDSPDGEPYLQIFSTCVNLIRTLPGLTYHPNRTEDVSDKDEDHAPEALRYGLMTRPSPKKLEEKSKAYTWDWWEQQIEAQKNKEEY